MRAPMTEVSKHGLITIPKPIREANNIHEGQQYGICSLGNGVLLLSPRVSQAEQMCDDLLGKLSSRGASLEEMLEELRRTREGEDS